LGYTIEIEKGYYFTETDRPFKQYVDKWYTIKKEAKQKNDTALTYIAKLYLNSLYGKLGQRRTFQKLIYKNETLGYYYKKYGTIKDYTKDLNVVVIEETSRSKYTTVHIASFITAYVRIRLYDLMEQVHETGGSVYYCDTDCIITDATLPTTKELGGIDTENSLPIVEGVFLAPKFYSYRMLDNSEHTRNKGLSNAYGFYDFLHTLKTGDFSVFSETHDRIASILECKQKHIPLLTVIEKRRKATGVFTKRLRISECHNTEPLTISE